MVDSVSPFLLLPTAEKEPLRTPDDVTHILRLHQLGWSAKRIAREIGCAKNTVKRYLAPGGWAPAKPPVRPSRLDGLAHWLAARFRQRAGNADVVRQDLRREHGQRLLGAAGRRARSHASVPLASGAQGAVAGAAGQADVTPIVCYPVATQRRRTSARRCRPAGYAAGMVGAVVASRRAASRNSSHTRATCLGSVLMLPMARRNTYRSPSFVCDRNASPVALTACMMRSFNVLAASPDRPAGA